MTAKRGTVLVMSLFFYAANAIAEGQVNAPATAQPLPKEIILWMFAGGIGAISITWVLVPWIFASRDKLDDLVELLRHGAVMRFVTVTYIVIVAVTLAIVDRLDGDKVSTLLASIAGYVLGQATSSRREDHAETRETPKPHADPSLVVRSDERTRPVPPTVVTGS